jgi:hypothetical protein
VRHHRQPNPRKTQDPPNRHRLHRRNSRRLQPEKPTANTKHPEIRLPQNRKNRQRIHPNSTIKHNGRREKGSRPILRPKNLQSTTHRQHRTLPQKNKQVPRSPTHTTKNLNKKARAEAAITTRPVDSQLVNSKTEKPESRKVVDL